MKHNSACHSAPPAFSSSHPFTVIPKISGNLFHTSFRACSSRRTSSSIQLSHMFLSFPSSLMMIRQLSSTVASDAESPMTHSVKITYIAWRQTFRLAFVQPGCCAAQKTRDMIENASRASALRPSRRHRHLVVLRTR